MSHPPPSGEMRVHNNSSARWVVAWKSSRATVSGDGRRLNRRYVVKGYARVLANETELNPGNRLTLDIRASCTVELIDENGDTKRYNSSNGDDIFIYHQANSVQRDIPEMTSLSSCISIRAKAGVPSRRVRVCRFLYGSWERYLVV